MHVLRDAHVLVVAELPRFSVSSSESDGCTDRGLWDRLGLLVIALTAVGFVEVVATSTPTRHCKRMPIPTYKVPRDSQI